MLFSRLRKAPSLEEFDKHIVRFDPLPASANRPFWSVMIPTYNRPAYLQQTLESVLSQDPGPAEMQIQVCDNYSDVADIESLVRKLGRGRVEYFRQPRPLSDNHNTCIRHARGNWVHILHDDDMVLPGFYAAYRRAILLHPDALMFHGRFATMDSTGAITSVPDADDGPESVIVEDFLSRQFFENHVKFPTTVVRRDAYEKVGGFCGLLRFLADMDMWFRIGLIGPVGFINRALSLYRVHESSDTCRQMNDGNLMEHLALAEINLKRLGLTKENSSYCAWKRGFLRSVEIFAWSLDDKGMYQGRLNQIRGLWRINPNLRNSLLLAKSWLKWKLRGNNPV
jgi:glycosyltransferase involved in cell wall biosynthesis